MTMFNEEPYTWCCDYCEMSVDMNAPRKMPRLWTRLMLSENGWVDVCPGCLEDALAALEWNDINPIEVIADDKYNESFFVKKAIRRSEF